MANKLTKSTTDKKLCGVCGGIAKSFGIDSSIVRLVWLACVLLGGFGVLLYLIFALVLPKE